MIGHCPESVPLPSAESCITMSGNHLEVATDLILGDRGAVKLIFDHARTCRQRRIDILLAGPDTYKRGTKPFLTTFATIVEVKISSS